MLEDKEWLDSVYFPGNLRKLKSAFEDCQNFFDKLGCEVKRGKAGLFAWVNLSKLIKGKVTAETEKALFLTLLEDYKLYVPNGTEFGSQDPGWFRLIFAIDRDHWKEICLRLETFVHNNDKK